MATVSQDDINDIVSDIEFEVADIDQIVPTGRTLEQMVAVIAPKQLDYINSRLFALYSPQDSPLDSQVLTILKMLTLAEILYFGYRTSVIDEKEWPDQWRNTAVEWLDEIAKGRMGLESPTRQSNYTPKFDGEPRYFTMRSSDDFTRSGITDLNNLFGGCGDSN